MEAFKPSVPATPAHITFWALEMADAQLLRVNARRAGIAFKARNDANGGLFTCKMDDVPMLLARLRDWHKSFVRPGAHPAHPSWQAGAEALANDCEYIFNQMKENEHGTQT